jgi:hypothetical protein
MSMNIQIIKKKKIHNMFFKYTQNLVCVMQKTKTIIQ